MNKEYYTPEIENLFIGYECEIQETIESTLFDGIIATKYSESWKKIVLTKQLLHYYIELLETNHLRTLYLTKEQIENEGWQVTDEGVDSCGNPIFYKEYQNELNIFNCKYYLEFTHCNGDFGISLCLKRSLFDDSVVSYKYTGNCPSINEFRKICKLLEIE